MALQVSKRIRLIYDTFSKTIPRGELLNSTEQIGSASMTHDILRFFIKTRLSVKPGKEHISVLTAWKIPNLYVGRAEHAYLHVRGEQSTAMSATEEAHEDNPNDRGSKYQEMEGQLMNPAETKPEEFAILKIFRMAGYRIPFFQGFLTVLIVLQLFWYLVIGLTNTYTHWDKLQFLILYSLVCGTFVILLPKTVMNKLDTWKSWLLEKDNRVILLLCGFTLLAGIIYAAYQRTWNDEKAVLTAARIIDSQGFAGILTSYTKISWLRFQHPPLMPAVYSLAVRLFGENIFWSRQVSVIFMAATVVVTYLLGREFYGKETGLLASIVLITFPLTIRLGSLAMMDIELTFFFSLALLLVIRLIRTSPAGITPYGNAVLIGVLTGLGMLTKYIMVFFFGVLASYWLFIPSFRKFWLHLTIVFVLSVSMLGGWLVFASQNGILEGQVQRVLEFSGIYYLVTDITVAPDSADSEQPPPETKLSRDVENRITLLRYETLFTRLPSSLGVYHLPLILLGIVAALRRRSSADFLILLWIGVVFLALFLTLPDHRYFMATFPAIAILIGNYLERFPKLSVRVVILALLFAFGALYMFVDWSREAHLFLPDF